jgi:phage-related protein
MPHSKQVRDDLFELRLRGKREVRIFYIFRKNKVILLSGFLKKTQELPKKEIEKALQKKDEYDII